MNFRVAADYKSGFERPSPEGNLEWIKIAEVSKLEDIFPDLKYYWSYIFKKEERIRYGYMLYPKPGIISEHKIL